MVVLGRGQTPGIVPAVVVAVVAATCRRAAVVVMGMVIMRMIRILIQSLDPGYT